MRDVDPRAADSHRFNSRIASSNPSSVGGYMRSLGICFMIWIEGSTAEPGIGYGHAFCGALGHRE